MGQQCEVTHSKSVAELTLSDLERMEAFDWSIEDWRLFDEISRSDSASNSQLATNEFVIDVTGSSGWRVQSDIYIPSNSIVRIYDWSGSIRYANDGRSCGPPGSNAVAGGGFTRSDCNAHCFLLGIRRPIRIPGDPDGPDTVLVSRLAKIFRGVPAPPFFTSASKTSKSWRRLR
jgi:hypothetical protein